MITLQPLYDYNKPIREWPSLSRFQAIPDYQKSKYAELKSSVSGLGLLKAITAVLCRSQGDFQDNQQTWTIRVRSSSSSKREYVLSGDQSSWYVVSATCYLLAIAGIMDAHTPAGQRHPPEFFDRWQNFVAELELFCHTKAPFTPEQLQRASKNANLNDLCMGVCDALSYYLRYRIPEIAVIDQPAPNPSDSNHQKFEQIVFGCVAHSEIQCSTPLVKSLRRLIRRGGTALLCGSTGVGKTEAVKAASLAEGAALVKMAGHPGLDDRQLFGSTYPDGKGGFQYVEGPLSEAWRYAAEGKKVVLLIDELARMDPYYHSVLLGALDTFSGIEIKARPRFTTSVTFPIQDDDRYYALLLPNGQVLIAPTCNLSVVCTTNLGSDYQQATTHLDPALMRRFQLHFDVERMEVQTRMAILRGQGLPKKVVELIVQLEEFTVKNTAVDGGLLSQAANLGVLINWGNETRSLVDEGASWKEALDEASKTTVIPFVCPRLSNGRLEAPAVEMFLEELQRLLRVML